MVLQRVIASTISRASSRRTSTLGFEGRVAVVTGAGNGLGKEYALELGRRGASVVVNDFGGVLGAGGSTSAADAVVAEIIAAGGSAKPNYASVEHASQIIDPVMEEFGKVDILINNAGILRDKNMLRISQEDWDDIISIHLTSAFKISQAVFPFMKENKYGKIVNTTSASGIYGNFGQVNYSAAKMGLVGLTKSIAIEGRKSNVHANAIAPLAASRMTEKVFPSVMLEKMDPKFVMPLYLCHESCSETGSVFEVAAGWAAKIQTESAAGAVFAKSKDEATLESVQEHFDALCDFEKDTVKLNSLQEATIRVMDAIMK
ncbi:unnamed protein product [Oikopleura dioica]|uniref:Ketoreductase domain-containing protein n=1 Tax=Oikopleura dioica TaxID=34765 RepID=E4WXK6_OIKDI|nr:unnamed protein product [Oikopleura dioica]